MVKLPQEVNRLNPNKLYVLNGTNSDSGTKVLTCDYVFPAPYDKLNEIVDHDELIYEILADTRTRKSQDEIDLLKYINQVTVEGHIEAMKKISHILEFIHMSIYVAVESMEQLYII